MKSAAGAPCRGCGRPDPAPVLDLGLIPPSDYFPPYGLASRDAVWPLTWLLCPRCLLVQLGPADGVLPEPPTGIESATSLAHATAMASSIVAETGLRPGATFIEIDSHHGGSWRETFTALGLRELDQDGQADLVVDVHGIAHEEGLAGPLAAHARRLAPGGRLVLEFHHLLALVQQDQIDTIRHGHWVYLSALSMSRLLADHGLTLTHAREIDVFGGSVLLTAQLSSENPVVDETVPALLAAERAAGLDSAPALAAFGVRGRERAAELRRHLQAAVGQGRSVAGYGAPSKAPVLLALADVDEALLPYTVDKSPAKHGMRLPGVGLPIHSVDHLLRQRPHEVVVLTWDIADEIVSQLEPLARAASWDPDFVVPLPTLRYVAGPRFRQPQASG